MGQKRNRIMNTSFRSLLLASSFIMLAACNGDAEKADAYGNFEVDETTISAKVQGDLLAFTLEEGQELEAGEAVGYIDTIQLHLQRAELAASLLVTEAQKANLAARISVARDELKRIQNDQSRIEKMYNQKAATQKQLDDINSAAEIARKNLQVLETQYPSIAAQAQTVKAKTQLLEQRIRDAVIVNPVRGRVLTKLVQAHEMLMPGQGLYIVANLDQMFLRAYMSADQLAEVQLGQQVKVLTDGSDGKMKETSGTISWISSKSEFTPKTIQTKNERANTVYAFKVKVQNDGTYKMGMHGEIKFH
jgi:HlyD family secretion protein